MRAPTARRAFTLIELLIVVAIIAILAAIAVPNFLEAQTRAKVSRTYADMRSVATAQEAYRIDHNRYPLTHFDMTSIYGLPVTLDMTFATFNPRIVRYIPLTTPNAYITSIPKDIFTEETDPDRQYWRYADRDSYFAYSMHPIYVDFFQMDYPAASWLFRSIGPGRVDVNTSDGFGIEDIYDATNGTISRGNIVFAGPGISVIGR
ncbi:MAG: prepilin-type N-terminal cleavage/methylation domain-containing protein [Candidatus Sumerlaeia bacterium]|nr:prepilin-type N-terminal cleavage/methylation domain-containing protein [Candidatus Sumerlaeia bacterium]